MKRRQFLQALGLGSLIAAVKPALRVRDRQALAAKLSLSSDDVYWLASLPWLKMIAAAEGTLHLGKEAYLTTFRYGKFTSFEDHPRRDIPIPGDPRRRTSDAAGPYQILSSTWDRTRREYPNIWLTQEPAFSPANQDRAALALSHRTGGSAALLAGVKVLHGHLTVSHKAFKRAVYADSIEWASLPGHNIGADSGQHTKSLWWLWTEYQWALWGTCGYRRQIVSPLQRMQQTSGFGMRWGRLHKGIDFAAAIGTPVRSPEAATVTKLGRDETAGRYVVLVPEGFPELELSFCHLSKVMVQKDNKVGAGDVFALTGATGTVTGPHLHFGLWVDGGVVNPHRYLKMAEWF